MKKISEAGQIYAQNTLPNNNANPTGTINPRKNPARAPPFLTSTENISVVLDLAGFSPAQGRARAVELLEYLDVSRRKDAFPAQLSGGEAQRVAIGRALANRPRIILADEPTAALDSQRAQIVMDMLRRVAAEQQAAVIIVTHDEKIFGRLDRIYQLRDGELVD